MWTKTTTCIAGLFSFLTLGAQSVSTQVGVGVRAECNVAVTQTATSHLDFVYKVRTAKQIGSGSVVLVLPPGGVGREIAFKTTTEGTGIPLSGRIGPSAPPEVELVKIGQNAHTQAGGDAGSIVLTSPGDTLPAGLAIEIRCN